MARLVSLTVRCDGPLIDLEDAAVRNRVAREHAELLAAHQIAFLDEGDVLIRDRAFTQALAGDLHKSGAAGITYPSNVRTGRCRALFEPRYSRTPTPTIPASLVADEHARALLAEVCNDFGLRITTIPT